MKVVIIKYNAGNVRSVLFSLEQIGVEAVVSCDPKEILAADRVIFPGVGEASSAMKHLREKELDRLILSLKQPVLGICLGMQLMCCFSEENDTDCLGIFDQQVKAFPKMEDFKIPQMGWNTLTNLKSDLFHAVPDDSYMYFVHGYYVGTGVDTISTSNYIFDYSSGLQKDNFYGLQFHPEKSGVLGQQILKNFIQRIY